MVVVVYWLCACVSACVFTAIVRTVTDVTTSAVALDDKQTDRQDGLTDVFVVERLN